MECFPVGLVRRKKKYILWKLTLYITLVSDLQLPRGQSEWWASRACAGYEQRLPLIYTAETEHSVVYVWGVSFAYLTITVNLCEILCKSFHAFIFSSIVWNISTGLVSAPRFGIICTHISTAQSNLSNYFQRWHPFRMCCSILFFLRCYIWGLDLFE